MITETEAWIQARIRDAMLIRFPSTDVRLSARYGEVNVYAEVTVYKERDGLPAFYADAKGDDRESALRKLAVGVGVV